MAQEFVWPLALANTAFQITFLPSTDDSGLGGGGILYAALSAHQDGSCDYFPYERAGAAAFSHWQA